jgi:hypothetical protein
MAEPNVDIPVWNPASVTHGAERSAPPYHHAPLDRPFQHPNYNNLRDSRNDMYSIQIHDVCPPLQDSHAQRLNLHRGNLQAYENQRPPACPYWQPLGRPRMIPSPYSEVAGERAGSNGPVSMDNMTFTNPQPVMHSYPNPFPLYSPGYDPSVPPSNPPAYFDRQQHYPGMIPHAPALNFGGQYHAPAQDRGSPPRPRQPHQHGRRQSQQESHRYSNRSFDRSERHMAGPPTSASYRPDGVQAQQTSNRRDFDHFSQDPFRLRSSSDAEEAAARVPPSSRARRISRNVRPREFFRAPIDPNVPTPQQVHELKEKLSKRVLSEIPLDASSTCDICAKDYSGRRVQPCEEEEMAVELSCGHRFGEFCIAQWVC